jgi:2-polyprenyl-3-methyl-5-hydroxy-6-metoxy-1,4-benzoquinol methylase
MTPENSQSVLKCPLCTGDMREHFITRDYRRPDDSRQWPVVWCASCRYGTIAADLHPADVASFYDIDYYTHQLQSDTTDSRTFFDKIRIHLAWRFDYGATLLPDEVGPRGSICDIGCGNGSNLQAFRDSGFTVTGIEPDTKARQVAANFATVYAGTAENLPAALTTKFDYVLLSHVLEHTISLQKALSNVAGMLKDDGKLIIEVPNCEAAGFAQFAQYWPWTDVPRHIHFLTLASIGKFLEQAGLRITKVYHLGYARQFSNEWIETLHTSWNTTSNDGGACPNYLWQSWKLLLRTLTAPATHKYDSFRVHATKIHG